MRSFSVLLNTEYAGMHGFYWMLYGITLSFAAVFLQARGYSNSELGVIPALGNIVALVLQPLVAVLGVLVERSGVGVLSKADLIVAVLLLALPAVGGKKTQKSKA